MLTQEIRRQFLKYFKEQGHAVIASSPVIPHDDPTLLFINAGMNQFKDLFLGKGVRDYTRATSSQKCIRVGGKHNDLENVGHTSRHLTFFEMLGNFSFGDYFKAEAIQFAWEVSTKVYGLDPKRIWPTVYLDDDEAFELWTNYVPPDRITRFGEKENFWAMGDTGPCGPCSELLYDRGPKYGDATKPSEDASGERFLEYWNLVFMQYNRSPAGEFEPLPKPSIDTGAGLERVVSLKMEVDSLFETDLLRGLIAEIEKVSGKVYDINNSDAAAFRVIADHLRCLSFAIADGVQPSNVDRGYVLRKVLRRAVRYGRQLGMEDPFLAKIFPRLLSEMGGDYRELQTARSRIEEIITVEEEAFIRTLRRGGNILNQIVEKSQKGSKLISGDDAFKLKDTYGLPIDEILLLAKDADLSVDEKRYQELEQNAKERSRSVHKTTHQLASENLFTNFAEEGKETTFVGYSEVSASGKVIAIVVNGELTDSLHIGEEGMIVLDRTPFYAEMGGQIGDSGTLNGPNYHFIVNNTLSPFKGIIAHVGKVENGQIGLGDSLEASIDFERRQKIANNHTATHLLHWALHYVLGEHIKQAGSIVDPLRLRFDFSHHKGVSQEELYKIEDLVNEKIRENIEVAVYEISYEEAQKQADIKQFFGEKYGSKVRVIDINKVSRELCGGTHTTRSGNIGLFKISKESSIAAGIRRIEAVTGTEAENLARESEKQLDQLAATLKTQAPKLSERIGKLLEENKSLLNELKEAKKGKLGALAADLVNQAEIVEGKTLLAAQVDLDADGLRTCADDLNTRIKSGILVLAVAAEDRCQLIIRVSDDLVAKGISALELIKSIAPIVGGSGGGKSNSAQAGGKLPDKIPEAIAKAKELLTAAIKG
ncbi:MAG: alanine--tRNA ligase [Parachlamydiaceae bacterium]|nr:alanine--tRNA ligase [Parachlamydiaceae bacterium]